MRGRWFAAGLLSAVGVLAWAVPSRAGDTVRLNGGTDAPAQNLIDDGKGADTIRTWHRGFGGWGWGGYRGFGWGGYRGFGWGGYGGWGGYRGFGLGYGGFYRPYYGGFGLGYGGLGFGRLGYGLGYGRFGYGLGWGGLGYGGLGYGMGWGGLGYGGFGYGGFGYGGLFGPCSGLEGGVYTLSAPVVTLNATPAMPLDPRYTDVNPPAPPAGNGTYPYDGGPATPGVRDARPPAKSTPQRTVPLEGRSVSLTKPAAKWTYPAYGETARRGPDPEQTYLTRGRATKPGSN